MVTPVQIVKRKRALNKYVRAHGGNPKGLNFAPVAGPVYRKWISWLQRREWPKLAPTGIADTRVLAVLFPPKPQRIGAKALAIGGQRVGVHESGLSNRGPVVDLFLAACGFHFKPGQEGVPWCGCFVTWCLRQAGYKGSGWNMAYVPAWVVAAHAGEAGLRVIGRSDVEAGDICCFDWGRDGIADHIGFARGPVKNGELPTREGNTSSGAGGSQSNGGQVADRTRSVNDVICFIRID